MSHAHVESRDSVLDVRHTKILLLHENSEEAASRVFTSSNMFRILTKVQDTVTRIVYGVEQQTRKMSFYACVDKDMSGNSISVRPDSSYPRVER